jgi:hypothetical protein
VTYPGSPHPPHVGGNRDEGRRPQVSGTVLGRDGWPLEPATVTLVGSAGAQLGRAAVGGDGRFVTATARLDRKDFRMNWDQAVEVGLSLVGTHRWWSSTSKRF